MPCLLALSQLGNSVQMLQRLQYLQVNICPPPELVHSREQLGNNVQERQPFQDLHLQDALEAGGE